MPQDNPRMLSIAVPTTTYDCETGKVKETGTTAFYIMPPDTSDGKCPECAVLHAPEQPHNQQSLVYQYGFYARHNRWPTWSDAMTHCTEETRNEWKAELQKRGAWSEPPAE